MTKFSNTYENFLVIGDFNMTPENENMIDFFHFFCETNQPVVNQQLPPVLT